MNDITIFSSSNIQETIEYYKNLRLNSPIFWSEKYNAWVLSRYSDIKNILIDDSHFPIGAGNNINALSNSSSEEELIQNKLDGYDKYHLIVEFYKLYFKGMPTESFIQKNLLLLNKVFSSIPIEQEINLTQKLNYPSSLSFIYSFINFSDIEINLYNELINNVDYFNFTEIYHKISPTTNEYISNFNIYKNLIDYLNINNINEYDYYKNILIEFVNSHIKETQSAITGLQNGILFAINNNKNTFLNMNSSNLLNFVDESIRYITFNSHISRKCLHDYVIYNQKIKRGDNIILLLGSANFDETIFGEDSNTFNINRNINIRTLEFGMGNHFCIAYRAIRHHLHIYLKNLFKIKDSINITNIIYDNNFVCLGSPIKEIYGILTK
jgi:hypothetical protein